MLYFWKAEGSRMSNRTFPCANTIQLGPSPFNSSPQCKKSSLLHHFRQNSWKLGSQRLLFHAHFWWNSKFSFFPSLNHSQGHVWAKMSQNFTPLTPKKWQKNWPIWVKNGKKRTAENFRTTYLDPKSKINCTDLIYFNISEIRISDCIV